MTRSMIATLLLTSALVCALWLTGCGHSYSGAAVSVSYGRMRYLANADTAHPVGIQNNSIHAGVTLHFDYNSGDDTDEKATRAPSGSRHVYRYADGSVSRSDN